MTIVTVSLFVVFLFDKEVTNGAYGWIKLGSLGTIQPVEFLKFIVIWFLAPWFDLHPLKFPVTEGKLAVTTSGLILRGLILTITALISGYIPAKMVTKQNTLDAILGR